jgi:hypothetical protein
MGNILYNNNCGNTHEGIKLTSKTGKSKNKPMTTNQETLIWRKLELTWL